MPSSPEPSPSSDRGRVALSHSIYAPSPLRTVAGAIAVATEYERVVYVERLAEGWRWSLAAPGGPYPLLRITARFLQMDYHSLLAPYETVAGHAILALPGPEVRSPQAFAFVHFDGPGVIGDVELEIVERLL